MSAMRRLVGEMGGVISRIRGVDLSKMRVLFTAAARVLLITGAEVTNPDSMGVRKAFMNEGSLSDATRVEGCGSEIRGVEPCMSGEENKR